MATNVFCSECHRMAKYGVFSGNHCANHRKWYDILDHERDIIVQYQETPAPAPAKKPAKNIVDLDGIDYGTTQILGENGAEDVKKVGLD